MLLSGGQLDQTFGNSGVVSTDLGGTEQTSDVALQSDGKIVVVGSTSLGNGDMFVIRYNSNGSVDTTFGRNGSLTLDFGGADTASSVAIQPGDGKIVVAGTTSLGQNFAVARLNTNGTLDAGFGRGGIVTTDLGGNDVANSVALQANGDIVVGGSSDNRFALFRYKPDGTTDSTFGNSGKAVIDISGSGATNTINDVIVASNGTIVAGGVSGSSFALAGFTQTGALDATFGTGGKTITTISGRTAAIHDLAFDSKGRIDAVGDALDSGKGNDDFAIARYTSTGTIDGGFGTNGVTLSDFNVLDVANGVIVQPTNQKIDVAGVSTPGTFRVARYNTDGTLDTSFGTAGSVAVPLGSAAAIAYEPDFKIVVAGTVSSSDIQVARYFIGNPLGDLSFSSQVFNTQDGAGFATITVERDNGSQGDVKVHYATSDGTATAGVQYTAVSGTLDFPQGVTTQTFQVPIRADGLIDGTTSVNLTLSNPQGGGTLGDNPTAVLQIKDAPGALQFSAGSYNVTENVMTANITVTRSVGDGGQVTVDFATVGGSAVPNKDYQPTAGTLIFPDGVLTESFPITILNDPSASGTLTVALALSNPGGGATLGVPAAATLNIQVAPGDFELLNPNTNDPVFPNFSAQEDSGTATITVQRLNGSDGPGTVDFATSDGTAKAFVNYIPTSGTLNFAAGQTSATFPIQLISDGTINGNLSVNIAISNPTGGPTLGGRKTAQLVIIDSPGKLQFSGPSFVAQEAGGVAYVAVTRTVGVGGLVTVDYATSDGTAVAGTDYTASSGTLAFGPGEVAKLIAIPISNDGAIGGGNKTFTVTLTNAGGGATLGQQSAATVSIIDAHQPTAIGDYDADGKTEFGVFRPPTGQFLLQRVGVVSLGQAGNIPVPGNYDGNGLTEVAVFDPKTATWTIQGANVTHVIPFGQPGVDVPVPADYDGDGKTDLAVYRPTTGQYFIMATTQGPEVKQVGQPGNDIPVPGDYDKDGLADAAVFRPSTGQWLIQGSTAGPITRQFGAPKVDKPVPADYDGDGQTDLAIFRPTTAEWLIIRSTSGVLIKQFGQPGVDVPVPGDYDGDGKADLAVFRPTTDQWFIQYAAGGGAVFQFGQPGVDIPATPPVAFRQTGAIAGSSISVKSLAAVTPASPSTGPAFVGAEGAALRFAAASTPHTPSVSALDTLLESTGGGLGAVVHQGSTPGHNHHARHFRLRPIRHHG